MQPVFEGSERNALESVGVQFAVLAVLFSPPAPAVSSDSDPAREEIREVPLLAFWLLPVYFEDQR